MTEITIGVDISKEFLDVHRLPDGQSGRFTNNKAGYKALAAFIGKGAVRVVFEPTGPIIAPLNASSRAKACRS